EALRRGASDLLEKPAPHDRSNALCERIWALARAPIRSAKEDPRAGVPARAPKAHADAHVAAIGLVASTGGPAALATILGALPAELDAAILVVQHLPSGFAPRLAR